jgi:Domain of unknown function (DUF4365)
VRVLLDTNAYSALRRGDEVVADHVRRSEEVLLSIVVARELLFGFRNGSRYKENVRGVRELEEQSAIVLDNESKDRALVGEVISTVALAVQLSREFNVSDHGIDMEIEFKSDDGEATGQKLYLQLKSGDSYLRERKSDSSEIFTIKEERHARYWMAQKFPVLLVIRNSEGEVRWMEVRDWLKRASDDGKKPVKQIVFEGERFDVMSVRRWRDRALG